MGPWQDQGTVVEKEKRTVWDWWRNNGDTAVDAAGDIFCLFSPNSPQCRPEYPQGNPYYAAQPDNTVLYLLIGVILLLALILILNK